MTDEIIIKETDNIEIIKERILEIRGQRVMLDKDLAELYGVETKRLNEAVKRNINRFPDDFMFVLTDEEWLRLRSQIATSKRGGNRYRPFAFTEYGIAMLSSVLHSETAIQVNINIMRAFISIRHAVAAMLTTDLRYEQLSHKIDQLNAYVEEILHDQNDINAQQEQTNNEIAIQIEALNDALDKFRETKSEPRRQIGFKQSQTN